MNADVPLVAGLQRLDQKIAELQQEIAFLPQHIAAIEKTLEQHLHRLDADRLALVANQKDRKRLEEEIKVHEQKISKLRDQMLQAKTNEQYRAFQNEISFCETSIRAAEDRILDGMGEADPLEKNVRAAEASLKQERAQVESEKRKAEQKTAADRSDLDELDRERKETVSRIKPAVYKSYEHLRKKRKGIGVTEVNEDRCGACNMALRPQLLQDLRRGDEVLYCEVCGRMLYLIAPQSFEDQVDAQPGAAAPPSSGV
ncbi:MAG: C4-type zinc ribbon domain-containing protein [Acidobacteria bacterium]|nr:C4-type zinc ribbon domain-containing protein [Acidobacteriota bacterium]